MEAKRLKVRMLLGRWGSWTVQMDRLRREQDYARRWLEEEGGELPHELLRHIEGEMEELARLRNALSGQIALLSAEEQRVLVLRYEQNLNWLQVGLRMNYDARSVRRLEQRAVDELSQWIEGQNISK